MTHSSHAPCASRRPLRWLTRLGAALGLAVGAVGCAAEAGESGQAPQADEGALRTEDGEEGGLVVEGAVRAEWRETSSGGLAGGHSRTLRVIDDEAHLARALRKLEATTEEPDCSATRSNMHWGGRMGPGRTIPQVSESIVLLDAEGKRLGALSIYPCEGSLVTFKAGTGPRSSYRMKSGFRAAFSDAN